MAKGWLSGTEPEVGAMHGPTHSACPRLFNTYNVVRMAAVLGSFEQAVLLAVVRLGADAYGRATFKDVEARRARNIAPRAAHPTPARLENKGLLASKLGSGTPIRAGRPRRYSRLLPAGV